MRKALKITAITLVTLVFVAVVGFFLLLRTNFAREKVRQILLSTVAGMIDGEVSLAEVRGGLLNNVTLVGIEIRERDGRPFLKIDTLTARYAVLELLQRRFVFSDARLVRPVVVLDQRTGEPWNYERIFRVSRDTLASEPKPNTLIVRFEQARFVDADITLRTPWQPDTTLSAADRNAAIRTALSDAYLFNVEPVAGSWQLVQRYSRLNASLPLVRVMDPTDKSIVVVTDSLGGDAQLFRGDPVLIRQASGEVEITNDSLLLRKIAVELPRSAMHGDGLYLIPTRNISARIRVDSVAGSDIRQVLASAPPELRGQMSMQVDFSPERSRYQIEDMVLAVRQARAQGAIDLTLGPTGAEDAVVDANLTLTAVDTRLLRELFPTGTEKLPPQGTFSGRIKATGQLASSEIDADIQLNDRVTGLSRVLLNGGTGYGDRIVFRNLNVQLMPVQVALARNVAPDFPMDGALSGKAVLNGRVGDSVVAAVDLEMRKDGRLSRVTGTAEVRGDTLPFLNWNLRADPLDLAFASAFLPDSAPKLKGLAAGSITLKGPLSALDVGMDMAVAGGGGSVFLEGIVDARSPAKSYDVNVRTERFNIASVMVDGPTTSLSSGAQIKGSGVHPDSIAATVDFALRQSLLAQVELDTARATGRLRNGVFEVDSLFALLDGARATGQGALGITERATGSLDVLVTVDSLHTLSAWIPGDSARVLARPARIAEAYRRARADSARLARETEVQRLLTGEPPPTLNVKLPPDIPADSVAGRLRFAGTLTGNIQRILFSGDLDAAKIVAAGMTVDTAHAKISGALLPLDSLRVEADMTATRATVAGYAIDSLAAAGRWRGKNGDVRVEVRQGADEHHLAHANISLTTDSTVIGLTELSLRFDSLLTWKSRYPSRIVFSNDAVSVDSLALDAGNAGFLRVSGRLAQSGKDSLDVEAFGVEVRPVLRTAQSDIDMRGRASASFTFTGSLDTPVFKGSAGFTDGALGDNPLPELHTVFDYSGGILKADLLASRNVGAAFATGTARIPLRIGRNPVAGVGDSAVSAHFKLDGVPLELVPDFTANVSRMRGQLMGELNVSGTAAAPVINGEVRVVDATAFVNSVGVQLDSISGILRLDGDTMVVERFRAKSGGPLVVTGGIGLAKLSEPSFDLRLSADAVYVLNNERGRLRADTVALWMRGPFASTTIEGLVRIQNGVLYIPDYSVKTVLAPWDTAFLRVLDTTDVAARELYVAPNLFMDNLTVNIGLDVARDTWVRSADANVELFSEGQLRVLMRRGGRALSMEGVLSTERGQYSFLSKRFEIRRGSATFPPADHPEINPTLQIVGEHEVQRPSSGTVNISVIIRGTMRSPRVTLESDAQPPLSQSDMLSYLAFGISSGSLLSGASALAPPGGGIQGVGKVAGQQLQGIALGAMLSEFRREAEGAGMRSLGLDLLNIKPAETYTEIAKGDVLSFLRQTDFEAGRYVNPRTFVAGQLRLSATPGVRVLHRAPSGFRLETAWEPRIVLREPTLREQMSVTKRAFSLFIGREWRF